jgi:hypothetical protein
MFAIKIGKFKMYVYVQKNHFITGEVSFHRSRDGDIRSDLARRDLDSSRSNNWS